MPDQGEAPFYPGEGGYGYGYAAPRGYPAPQGYAGSRHYEYPQSGYQGQGYGTRGMAPDYGPPPAHGYDNPPVPGYGYEHPSAPGAEGHGYYPGYRAAPPTTSDYPPAYPAPRAYAAPYGDPQRQPYQRPRGLEPGGFGAEAVVPGYPAPAPADYSAPPAVPGDPRVDPGAGFGMPMDLLPPPLADMPPPAAQPSTERDSTGGTAPAEEQPVAQPDRPVPEQVPASQAEAGEPKQEG